MKDGNKTDPTHVAGAPLATTGGLDHHDGHIFACNTTKILQSGDRVLELANGRALAGVTAARTGKPQAVLSLNADAHIAATLNRYAKNHKLALTAEWPGGVLAGAVQRCMVFQPTVLVMDMQGDEAAFLKQFDLATLRAIVIRFRPAKGDMAPVRAAKMILRRAGFDRVPGLSTRRMWTCTANPALMPPVPDGGWSTGQTRIAGAVVVPPLRSDFVQPAGVLHADGRHCPQGALWRKGRALTTAPEPPKTQMNGLQGRWLWGGVLWQHFGHFLVESTARLWALDELKDQIDGIVFIPKRPRKSGVVAQFQRDFIELCGFDGPVVCCAQPTRIDDLIVPGQGFGLGPLIEGTDAYRKTMKDRFAQDIRPDGPQRLYISRSQLPASRGTLIGEDLLERELQAQGYTIYHPQKYNLRHQIATYKAARHIIAAEGSALHLVAMVAKPDQRVAIIVRRQSSATNQLVRHLHAFSMTKPLTFCHLVRTWKPEGAARARLWMGELDLPALQSALHDAGFVNNQTSDWPTLSRGEVEKRLGSGFSPVPPRS